MAKKNPELPPVIARYVCVPDVVRVEMGRHDGSLLRIEAGMVHEERDPRAIGDLDSHWALRRVS